MARLIHRWRGVAISMIAVVAIGLLAIDGKLGLYVHPRYFTFTVVMMVVGGVLAVAACALVPLRGETDDETVAHEHASDEAHGARLHVLSGISVLIMVGLAVGMLVLSPQTLSAGAAEQRQVNDVAADVAATDVTQLVGADTASFTIRDWSRALSQGLGMDYFADKSIDVTGFVLADPDDADVFYVSRYLVTCCAIDAQPLGVPVYQPGWADTYAVGDWIAVVGGFETEPQAVDSRIVVMAATIDPIDEPAMPYVY